METIAQKIEDLNKSYKEGKISRTQYLKDHSKLVAKWKKLCRPKTLADRIREAGVKVTKKARGYYNYKGINFTVDIMEDSCETTWWEACIWDDGVDTRVFEYFDECNHFDRKQDVLNVLFEFDKSLSRD